MIDLNTSNFNKMKENRLLVEVFTNGCSPCETMKRDILPEIEGIVEIGLVNASEDIEMVTQIQLDSGPIMSVPVLLFYENGEFIWRKNGVVSVEEIKKLI